MKNKKYILIAGIAGIVLIGAVVLFMIKYGHDAQPDDRMDDMLNTAPYGRMEDMMQGVPVDDADIIINDSTVFESLSD